MAHPSTLSMRIVYRQAPEHFRTVWLRASKHSRVVWMSIQVLLKSSELFMKLSRTINQSMQRSWGSQELMKKNIGMHRLGAPNSVASELRFALKKEFECLQWKFQKSFNFWWIWVLLNFLAMSPPLPPEICFLTNFFWRFFEDIPRAPKPQLETS